MEQAESKEETGFITAELKKLFKPRPYNIYTLILRDAKQKAQYME